MKALCFAVAVFLSINSHAENRDYFRIGIGKSINYITPDNAYSRSEETQHHGITGKVDYLHSTNVMTRTYLYKFNGDVDGWGAELQLLAGLNLIESGLRIYTGPIWFRENRKDTIAVRDQNRFFSGLGWSIGTGIQLQEWSFDVSTTLRQNSGYVDYYEEKNVLQKDDSVLAMSGFATVSYRL